MAKPLTRLFRRLCNAMGYDLLRLQRTHIHAEGVGGHGRGGGFDAFEAVVPREVRAFDILFRSCARIEVQGQSRRRIVDAPKIEVVLRCLNSLIRAIARARAEGLTTDIRLCALDDHSDESCVARIRALLATAPCETRFVPLEVTGGGPAVGAALDFARADGRELIYFAEDDYLHDPASVLEIVRTFERLAAVYKRDVVLFPCDYPDRYRHVDPTHVVLGSHRHWRTVRSSTFTLATTRAIIERYWDRFSALRRYGIEAGVSEATTIAHVYREVPCLSPLASLAVHLQHFDTLSPYVDWRRWWEEADVLSDAGRLP